MIAVRYRTEGRPDADRRDRDAHRLLVDGRPEATIAYPDSGGGRWSIALARLPLREGANRVSLAPASGKVEVDCLDVILDPE